MKKLRVPEALKSKKVILAIVASTLLATAGVSAYTVNQTGGATEEPPIVKEVNRQGEQIDNHEGRITNAESDINSLQQNTNTAPSTTRVEVPAAPAPKQTPTPVATVVIASFEKIVVDENNTDCKLTYSDSTTYTFRWKTINGANTTTRGKCDASLIGQPKANTPYGY